jgi:phage terminase large subunit
MEIKIPYKPRPLQKKIHKNLRRFNVIVCHRRFGKTVFAINELIKTALTCQHKNSRVFYIAPLYKQAKSVAWDYAKFFSSKVPNVKVNESELRIDFPNGGRLQLLGADNPDSLRGIYIDQVVIDEVAQMPPKLWTEVVRPAISDRKGSVIWIGTPKGHNIFYDLYRQGQSEEEWFTAVYKASETGILDDVELRAAKKTMSEAEYDQEYECSWSAAILGAYYAKEMADAEEDGRITNVPYDPALPVITSWDLGVNDQTVVWFWQVYSSEIRAIDCKAWSGTGLPDIVKELSELPYVYSQHIAPHDIMVKELGSGLTRFEIAQNLGISFDVAPKQPVVDGINATRSMIPRIWFDAENCQTGIEALRQYRTEFNDRLGVFKNAPLHDWTSDYCDSVRYFAVTPLRGAMARRASRPKHRVSARAA